MKQLQTKKYICPNVETEIDKTKLNVPIDLGSRMQRLNKSKTDENQFFNKNNIQFIKKEM